MLGLVQLCCNFFVPIQYKSPSFFRHRKPSALRTWKRNANRSGTLLEHSPDNALRNEQVQDLAEILDQRIPPAASNQMEWSRRGISQTNN